MMEEEGGREEVLFLHHGEIRKAGTL